jgi:hypothetical protein
MSVLRKALDVRYLWDDLLNCRSNDHTKMLIFTGLSPSHMVLERQVSVSQMRLI